MSLGQIYRDPALTYTDQVSGRNVTRLTDYLGHSYHFYFTDPCWVDGGHSLLFVSDRENASNFFKYNLQSGEITQLTDMKQRGNLYNLNFGAVCESTNRLYFWRGPEMCMVDLATLELRVIYLCPEGFVPGLRAKPTADGKYVISDLREDPKQPTPGISYAYFRTNELFKARPLTRFVRVNPATGAADIIHELRQYCGHVNPSPVLPSIMTYCYQGGSVVDQRIWGLDVETGRVWKVRPQHGEITLGHEYWLGDGIHVAYQGYVQGTGAPVFGQIRWDNVDCRETPVAFNCQHFHSHDDQLVVGDGTPARVPDEHPYIQLFPREGDQFQPPRVLALHRSTFNNQHAHCHPRFTPDRKAVIYTSDLTNYSNIYYVEIGDLNTLPLLSEVGGTKT